MPPITAARLGVAIVHGVGSQAPGYSAPMVAAIRNRLGEAAHRVVWREIHWARALADRESSLQRRLGRARDPDGNAIALDWNAFRDFVVHNVGDALAYHRDQHADSAYAQIHRIVSDELAALGALLDDRRAPLVVIAHSFGAHIMSNYVWDRQHASPGSDDPLTPVRTLVSMITFGCSIPLFSLAFDVARPIHLPGRSIRSRELRRAGRWLNFLDRDDVLGWPLKPLYRRHLAKLTPAQRRTVARIEDREIGVGGAMTAWNPTSHEQYWTDDDLTRPVAAHLARLIDSL